MCSEIASVCDTKSAFVIVSCEIASICDENLAFELVSSEIASVCDTKLAFLIVSCEIASICDEKSDFELMCGVRVEKSAFDVTSCENSSASSFRDDEIMSMNINMNNFLSMNNFLPPYYM